MANQGLFQGSQQSKTLLAQRRVIASDATQCHRESLRAETAGDLLLDFHHLLEHDRVTEQQEHFRRRIKTCKAFLSSGVYKQLLATERITMAFTTFISARRVHQMRGWQCGL